ncbi:MAG: UbiD family decarboxylase, partial [Nitrospinota bacterium]|nr:UbiD family decarboxylase [Nitrospinota bacterium]
LLNSLVIPESLVHAEGVLDALDHSAPAPLCGAKLGIDATTPIPGEPVGPAPQEAPSGKAFDPATIWLSGADEVATFSFPFMDVVNPLLIISIHKRAPHDGHRIARLVARADTENTCRVILVLDEDVDAHDYSVALWKFFNNTDPKRDIVEWEGRLFIDATKKLPGEGHDRPWPDELTMDPDVKKRVDELWPRLGLGGSGETE